MPSHARLSGRFGRLAPALALALALAPNLAAGAADTPSTLAAATPPAVEPIRLGFEDAAVGACPADWKDGAGSASGAATWRVAVTDAGAFAGTHALAIVAEHAPTGNEGAAPSWRFDPAAFRDSAARVRFRAKAEQAPVATFTLGRRGHVRAFNGALVASPPDERGWRTYELELGVTEDAVTAVLSIQPGSAVPDATLLVDDVEVTAVAALADRPYEERFIPAATLASNVVHPFALRSELLSALAGHDVVMHAAIVRPDGVDPAGLPVAYVVHGFGGNHVAAWSQAPDLLAAMADDPSLRMVHVYLDGTCELGHHEFADSANNGPRGRALVDELIPAIERSLGGVRPASRRFVRGHSSGGWSALWLQLTYPDRFGGCWATAPDPVDFREFSGIDLYHDENAFRDRSGEARPLVVSGGRTVETVEAYAKGEMRVGEFGGQLASFEAVFSERGPDGRPRRLFDRTTGAIDRAVAESWRRYDIGAILRERWSTLGPALAGKLHVWCGEADTFRLDRAVRLLRTDLAALGSDADIILIPGRDHGSLFNAHETLWPKGMVRRELEEMAAAAARGQDARPAGGPAR